LNSYRIFETDEFIKKLNNIDSENRSFIYNKLKSYVYLQIRQEPYFGKNIRKLRAYTPETWRYRIGKFRLFYSIDQSEKIISILTINFRKDSYH